LAYSLARALRHLCVRLLPGSAMQYPSHFDVLVIGGGHAGTEACLAAARMGAKTLLLTHSIETLGQMSCNPSIGGIGKGHLVKEIDALGGVMAQCTDEAGIQFRILNRSKGPAVQATRAQADRALYRAAIRRRLENQPGLWIFQQAVDDLIVQGSRVTGAVTASGVRFFATTVILTAGTFLNGLIHVGLKRQPGGRAGDAPANSLAARLKELALPQGRLKTGTPPRIDGRTIDFSLLEEQRGDTDPVPVFSFLGSADEHPAQRCCWLTQTNEHTHAIIRANLDRSPMYSGVIEGIGPRYCPSIEDKIHRFATKSSHQIFLEPEGLTTNEVYPNGISTSLPFDVQLDLVRSIRGLQNAHLVRPGYAIEYDYYDPRALRRSLETKLIENLFFAGQINGSTGYEEAAAQGLLAGINAALKLQGREPWCPRRDEAYLGVLVDDLTTRGVSEPYRMFTSRAEYRLSLREDNADLRLTEIGHGLGCVSERRWEALVQKRDRVQAELHRLKNTWVNTRILEESQFTRIFCSEPVREHTLFDLLKRPQVAFADLQKIAGDAGGAAVVRRSEAFEFAVVQQVEIAAKYEGYIARQRAEIARHESHETTRIPPTFDYQSVRGLSIEVRQKLCAQRPETVGQAARISGVTPAAISLLLVFLKRWHKEHGAADCPAIAAPASARSPMHPDPRHSDGTRQLAA